MSMYRSLAKEHPLTKEHPPPTFDPFCCIGSKFTWMSAHPGASFAWSWRSTASSAMQIWGKKLCLIHVLHQRHLCTDRRSECGVHRELHHAHGDMVPFRVFHQDSTSKPLVVPMHVIVVSSYYKHNMVALSWLNAEPLERMPTSLFGRLVRCPAHGHSFVRLWHM